MIELIPLKLEYCEAVYEIAKSCLPEHWSYDGVKDVLRYSNNIYYVALNEDGEVEGFGGIMIVADEAELLNIAVKKEYRRCGIADQLMDRLIEEAKKAGAVCMLLEVREHNAEAQSLYNKKGFSTAGIRRNYYSNPTEDAVIMRKSFL